MPDPRFFQNAGPLTLEKLAAIGGATLVDAAHASRAIVGVAALDQAGAEEISFLNNPKYLEMLATTQAGACILAEKHVARAPKGLVLLVAKDPYVAYAKIARALHPDDTASGAISPAAHIAKSAKIGKGCSIAAGVVIGENVIVGDHTFIGANTVLERGVEVGEGCRIASSVTLSHTIIGKGVILHPGVRIGQDGFGFATENGRHIKVPQLGRVIVKDYADIGANTCIDRGAGPDTIIGQGAQIDNLVQIGHNVVIGTGAVIVAQVGIAGSTHVGDYAVLGGQVGVAGHLKIGAQAQVAAQSGVGEDIPAKTIVGGYPAVSIKQWHRQTVAIKRLIEKKGS